MKLSVEKMNNQINEIDKEINDYIVLNFKDYEQLEMSFSHIMEEVITYKESKDINFTGNYMFNFNDIKSDFPIYYMSINNVINSKNVAELYNFSSTVLSA